MSGETTSYLFGSVLLSVGVVMQVVGLLDKRRTILRYQGLGDDYMADFVREQFRGQIAGAAMIALALAACLFRVVASLNVNRDLIISGQILSTFGLLLIFAIQFNILSVQRRLRRLPLYATEPHRTLLRYVYRGTIVVTVLTGLLTATVGGLAILMQGR